MGRSARIVRGYALGGPGELHRWSAILPRSDAAEPTVMICQATAHGKRVGLSVGAHRRELVAFGNRRWVGARKSAEEPFRAVPITWENAFGGPGLDLNPWGKGHGAHETDDPARLWLPNIEDPEHLIRHPDDCPPPACWLAVPASFPVRARKLGTTDARWLKSRWPEPPVDFEPSFWDDAPPGMHLPELRGDETLVFENLHPERAEYTSRLPGLRLRLFALDLEAERPEIYEVPLQIARLSMDLHEETMELSWQGALPEPLGARGAEPRLVVEEERLADEPLPFEHYENAILAKYVTHEAAPEVRVPPPADNDGEALDPHLQKSIDEALAECRRALVEVDADPSLVAMLSRGLPDPDRFAAKVRQLYPLDQDQFEAIKERQRKELARALEERGEDPAIADQLHGGPGESREEGGLTRQEVVARHQRGESLAEEDLSELDLANLELEGIDLRGAILTGTNLTGTNLARADLREAALSGARMALCKLTQAKLDGADLTGADLEEADLALASAQGTVFREARLVRAMLDQADAAGASFEGADLSRVHGEAVALGHASLARTRLDDAMLRGADLRQASLEGAIGARIDLTQCRLDEVRAGAIRLTDADLKGAAAPRSMWPGAKLAGIVLIAVDLQGADLRETDLRDADLTGADLRGSDLSASDLSGAKLRGANLMRCDLREANLERTDLRDSNLYETETLRSRREGVKLDGAILARTKLSPDAPELPPGV